MGRDQAAEPVLRDSRAAHLKSALIEDPPQPEGLELLVLRRLDVVRQARVIDVRQREAGRRDGEPGRARRADVETRRRDAVKFAAGVQENEAPAFARLGQIEERDRCKPHEASELQRRRAARDRRPHREQRLRPGRRLKIERKRARGEMRVHARQLAGTPCAVIAHDQLLEADELLRLDDAVAQTDARRPQVVTRDDHRRETMQLRVFGKRQCVVDGDRVGGEIHLHKHERDRHVAKQRRWVVRHVAELQRRQGREARIDRQENLGRKHRGAAAMHDAKLVALTARIEVEPGVVVAFVEDRRGPLRRIGEVGIGFGAQQHEFAVRGRGAGNSRRNSRQVGWVGGRMTDSTGRSWTTTRSSLSRASAHRERPGCA